MKYKSRQIEHVFGYLPCLAFGWQRDINPNLMGHLPELHQPPVAVVSLTANQIRHILGEQFYGKCYSAAYRLHSVVANPGGAQIPQFCKNTMQGLTCAAHCVDAYLPMQPMICCHNSRLFHA